MPLRPRRGLASAGDTAQRVAERQKQGVGPLGFDERSSEPAGNGEGGAAGDGLVAAQAVGEGLSVADRAAANSGV